MTTDVLLNHEQPSDELEKLLALMLEEEGFTLLPATVIGRREEIGSPPLSFAQQRLWFLNQLEPGSPYYNIPAAVRLTGRLSVEALKQALNEIVQRHESLRTTFPSTNGRPVQSIAPTFELPLPIVILQGNPGQELEEQVLSLAAADARQPFDLIAGPLLRSTLLRLDDTEHVLLVTLHHIVSDGWSLGILIRELVVLYESFSANEASPLPPLPIQYADFAVWQREWLQGEVRQKQLDFWKQQLSAPLPRLELATDRARPAIQAFRGANQTLVVSKSLTEALKALSREEGATVFMSLLAAFVLLLHRYSGQNDIIVGSPTANRGQSETEGLIGFFANTLALRTRVSEQDSFRELLRQVRETTMGAYAHQDLPFEQLVEELQPERDLSRSPLFQVMLALQNAPMTEMKLPHLTLSALEIDNGTAIFDLLLSLIETEQGLIGKFVYNTDLFNGQTITRMLDHLHGLLEDIVKQPNVPLAELLARIPPQKLKLVVASTFTCEPLEDSLSFWFAELNIPARIEFAPYGQLFQQLLDPNGLLAGNKEGVNLILMRLEDWNAGGRQDQSEGWTRLERNVLDFLAALKSYAQHNSTATIIGLCPPSEAVSRNIDEAELILRLEATITAEAALLGAVSVLHYEEISSLYAVETVNDAHTDELGHVPYTPQFFTALGTAVAREVVSSSLSSYEVIALDCDDTLWGGVCGEDDPAELRTGFPYQVLQELLVQQHASGNVLCLCSKNTEADVFEVFRRHSGMALTPEHFTSHRISWDSTAEKLHSLAKELNLSLEKFVYLSSNPVECEEVRALCSKALTLRIPSEPAEIPSFLNHVWAFPRRPAAAFNVAPLV